MRGFQDLKDVQLFSSFPPFFSPRRSLQARRVCGQCRKFIAGSNSCWERMELNPIARS